MTTSKVQGGNQYGGPGQARIGDNGKSSAKAEAKDLAGVRPAGEVAPATGAKPAQTAKAAQAADIAMSDKARAYQKALDIARATPDVREDKVAALKKQIEEGTYKIDSGAIADGIAREAIMEHLAETEGR